MKKKKINKATVITCTFYDDVGIFERQRAFRNYFETYEVEAFDKKKFK